VATQKEIVQSLNDLVGFKVRVAIVPDGFSRNNFGPQIAVAAVLERKDDDNGQPHYRAMRDDDNFTYFTAENVVCINTLARAPTIMLSIPVKVDDENVNER
jgi:hypothetical protein